MVVTIHTGLKVRAGHVFTTGLKAGLAQKPSLESWSMGSCDMTTLGDHFLSLRLKEPTLPAPEGKPLVHTAMSYFDWFFFSFGKDC